MRPEDDSRVARSVGGNDRESGFQEDSLFGLTGGKESEKMLRHKSGRVLEWARAIGPESRTKLSQKSQNQSDSIICLYNILFLCK